MSRIFLLAITFLSLFFIAGSGNIHAAKLILGRFEYVRMVEAPGVMLNALVDSGAQTSALDARHIRTHMSRDGKRWVYFNVYDQDDKPIELHLPVTRTARIISHNTVTLRPVVQLTVMVGPQVAVTEVSLINRSAFPQPFLIGRSFLSGRAIIDTEEAYIHGKPE